MSGDKGNSISAVYPLSKYKLCDDTLFYPGCCAEHDRMSLASKNSNDSSKEINGYSNSEKHHRYTNFLSPVSPDSDNYSVSSRSAATPDDDDYFAGSSSHVTESLSHVVQRDDDNDDDALSYSSDDTVYESDAVVSACCTPVCIDAPVPIRNTDNVRRHCRSTTPPSRNVTPVAKEEIPKVHKDTSPSSATKTSLNVDTIPTAFGRDVKNASLPRSQKLNGVSLAYKFRMPTTTASMDFDQQSVSTLSGSGMEFFRKFVQKKGRLSDGKTGSKEPAKVLTKGCKDCESQFRRDVLIDRLVTDSLQNKPWKAEEARRLELQGGGKKVDKDSDEVRSPSATEASYSVRCKIHEDKSDCESLLGDVESVAEKRDDDVGSARTSVSLSTVSGSGLLFLRNYLRKKNANLKKFDENGVDVEGGSEHQKPVTSFFNSVPVPFPPRDDFYGPLYIPDELVFYRGPNSRRASSVGSTIADLLNETFDSEDSELRNLDWEEWEEDIHYDITEEDFPECDLSQIGNDEDLSSNNDVASINGGNGNIVYGCRYTAQQLADEIQHYIDTNAKSNDAVTANESIFYQEETAYFEPEEIDQPVNTHYGYYDDDMEDADRSKSVYENVSKRPDMNEKTENCSRLSTSDKISSRLSFSGFKDHLPTSTEHDFDLVEERFAFPTPKYQVDEDVEDDNEHHEICERREAVRCLSAAICRYTNQHSSDLIRAHNGSETDELLGRVASRASKLSHGRASGSRCSSRCSRETCRRNKMNSTKSTPDDEIHFRQSTKSSSFSSPLSSTKQNNLLTSPPMASSNNNYQSAFHHVPVREEEKVSRYEGSNNGNNNSASKNRMADFWEKSIQSTSQTDPEVPADGIKPIAYLRSLSDEQQKVGFRPALQTYYDPLAHITVNDRIQQFLEATRRAVDDQNRSGLVSRRSSVGDTLSMSCVDSSTNFRPTIRQNASDIRLRKTNKHYSTNSIADSYK